MRSGTFRGVSIACVLFLATAVGAYASMGTGDSASGHGTVTVVDENGNDARRQFSFSGSEQRNGTVRGNAMLRNPQYTGTNGQPYMLQIKVSCINVIGNVAFFGGTVRRTNDPNLVDAVFFSVQDNGEPGAGQDMISDVYFFDDIPETMGDPALCQNIPLGYFAMYPIESGNVSVRGGSTP